MPDLFTYTIPVDDGAAPNPFNGMCSLAICKPVIRRNCRVGDWVAGLGSKRAPSGDLSGRLVYAMRVEEVLTLQEYDRLAPLRWPHRVPNIRSMALQDRLGDCIYDYSHGAPPAQRRGVHGPINIGPDLRGENVLVSRDFYYFGARAPKLPGYLLNICHQTQGHRRAANASFVETFVKWVRGLGEPGQLYGWPDHFIEWSDGDSCRGCKIRKDDGEADKEVDLGC